MKRSFALFVLAIVAVSALSAAGAIATNKSAQSEAAPSMMGGYKAGKVTDHVMTQFVYPDGRIQYNYTVATTDSDNYYDLVGRPTNKVPLFSLYPCGVSEYCTSDYWFIPARTATGDICWPPDVC